MLEALSVNELPEAVPLFPPLLHALCILWVHCAPYRRGDRIVTLFQEITNLLIIMVTLLLLLDCLIIILKWNNRIVLVDYNICNF